MRHSAPRFFGFMSPHRGLRFCKHRDNRDGSGASYRIGTRSHLSDQHFVIIADGTRGPVASSAPAMPTFRRQHLQPKEIDCITVLVHQKGYTPEEACDKINKTRCKNRIGNISLSAVWRCLAGTTHKRGRTETRGRKKELTKRDLKILDQTRRRLLRETNSQRRVEYRHVLAEALPMLSCTPSQRTVEQKMRERGVYFRNARRKIYIGERDAKVRLTICKKWAKRSAAYWRGKTYIDHKKFPRPLTPSQRKRYMQTRVPGHLRTRAEGIARGCTRPRDAHTFLGVPSTTIGAAAAVDKMILWNEEGPKWNGATAAAFYKGPLLKALKKAHGERRFYHIVEDGDRKGYQSNKGVAAKKEVKIRSTVLPPRSPSLMPLDASLWTKILARMDKTAPSVGTETKTQFNKRLRQAALRLPKKVVRNAIAKMKPNIKAIVDAQGYIPRGD